MTKAYFKELATYNLWANTIACQWLEQLRDEQWRQHVVSSFNSISAAILHIVSAENAWLQRFNNEERVAWLQASWSPCSGRWGWQICSLLTCLFSTGTVKKM